MVSSRPTGSPLWTEPEMQQDDIPVLVDMMMVVVESMAGWEW